jgi:tetratricopeptide (TPR) repeat protein
MNIRKFTFLLFFSCFIFLCFQPTITGSPDGVDVVVTEYDPGLVYNPAAFLPHEQITVEPPTAEEIRLENIQIALQQKALQQTHKARMDAAEWNQLGQVAEKQGRLEEAKQCYEKSFNIAKSEMSPGGGVMQSYEEKAGATDQKDLEYLQQQDVIGIANILVKQGNKKEALAVYDTTCPDGSCLSPDVIRKKAELVRSMGDEARYKKLMDEAYTISKGKGLADVFSPLPPFITILGFGAAIVVFCRFSGRKKP